MLNSTIEQVVTAITNHALIFSSLSITIIMLSVLLTSFFIQRKDYVKKYKMSENKYQILIENANCIMFSLDKEANITYLSPQFYRMFKNVKYPKDIVSKSDYVKFQNKMKLQKKFNIILSLFYDNSIKYFEIYMEPVINGIIGWNGIAYDITERITLENKLTESNEILSVTNNGLKELFINDDFSGTIKTLLQNLSNIVNSSYACLFQLNTYKIENGHSYYLQNMLDMKYEWSDCTSGTWEARGYEKSIFIDITKLNHNDNYIIINNDKSIIDSKYGINLAIPIKKDNVLWGMLCFNNINVNDINISILGLASANIGAAIALRKSNEKLNNITEIYDKLLSSITILEEQKVNSEELLLEEELALQDISRYN